jgi:hypothetical protein
MARMRDAIAAGRFAAEAEALLTANEPLPA